jgi:hypothetical protein
MTSTDARGAHAGVHSGQTPRGELQTRAEYRLSARSTRHPRSRAEPHPAQQLLSALRQLERTDPPTHLASKLLGTVLGDTLRVDRALSRRVEQRCSEPAYGAELQAKRMGNGA